MFVGVAGFKPTMTDPNSVVLISYTIPQFKTSYCLSQVFRGKFNYYYNIREKLQCKISELFGIHQTFRLLL